MSGSRTRTFSCQQSPNPSMPKSPTYSADGTPCSLRSPCLCLGEALQKGQPAQACEVTLETRGASRFRSSWACGLGRVSLPPGLAYLSQAKHAAPIVPKPDVLRWDPDYIPGGCDTPGYQLITAGIFPGRSRGLAVTIRNLFSTFGLGNRAIWWAHQSFYSEDRPVQAPPLGRLRAGRCWRRSVLHLHTAVDHWPLGSISDPRFRGRWIHLHGFVTVNTSSTSRVRFCRGHRHLLLCTVTWTRVGVTIASVAYNGQVNANLHLVSNPAVRNQLQGGGGHAYAAEGSKAIAILPEPGRSEVLGVYEKALSVVWPICVELSCMGFLVTFVQTLGL